MKKYTFEIGPIHDRKIASVWINGRCDCQKAEDQLPLDSNPRLLSITKRMPMNGITNEHLELQRKIDRV